jgi:hypothetical protein
VAVDIRSWFWRATETDVAVMKILASPSIKKRKLSNSATLPLFQFVLFYSQLSAL